LAATAHFAFHLLWKPSCAYCALTGIVGLPGTVNDVRMTTKWLQFVERRWDKGEKTGDAEWRYRSLELSSMHVPSKRDEPRAH
jgi:hypothetical protein